MSQPKFLFQFLIVALDDPALFGQRHHVAQRDMSAGMISLNLTGRVRRDRITLSSSLTHPAASAFVSCATPSIEAV